MFEALRQAGHKATHPFEGFLEEVWTVWQKDVGRAVLMARRSWQSIPEAVAQQAAAIEAQANAAREHQQIMEVVNLQMGLLGASPGGGGFGPAMNPDHALFLMIMGSIRLHHGNPPPDRAMVPLAAAVLSGQLDPIQALIACTPATTQAQVAYAIQVLQMTGMGHLMRVLAVIQAAIALPEEQIATFLPAATTPPATSVRLR